MFYNVNSLGSDFSSNNMSSFKSHLNVHKGRNSPQLHKSHQFLIYDHSLGQCNIGERVVMWSHTSKSTCHQTTIARSEINSHCNSCKMNISIVKFNLERKCTAREKSVGNGGKYKQSNWNDWREAKKKENFDLTIKATIKKRGRECGESGISIRMRVMAEAGRVSVPPVDERIRKRSATFP